MYYALIIVLILIVAYQWKHRTVRDIDVPTPAKHRDDLLYGYYGTMDDQVAWTRGCVNLLWECQFQGWVKAADNMASAGLPTLLDVANQCFHRIADHGKNYAVHPTSEQNLRDLFNYLKSRGVLHQVEYLCPLDEPNTNCATPQDFLAGIMACRKVAAEYTELAGIRFAVVYAAYPASFTCIEQFDLVGVDDYEAKSTLLMNVYQDLLMAKRPDAKTILLPGGAFGQDPTPFMNWAHSHREVALVAPFTWLGPMVPADKWVGLGNPENPRHQQYLDIGRSICGRG